jgi:hypothetical protein
LLTYQYNQIEIQLDPAFDLTQQINYKIKFLDRIKDIIENNKGYFDQKLLTKFLSTPAAAQLNATLSSYQYHNSCYRNKEENKENCRI